MGQAIKLDDYLRERGPIPPGKAGRIAVDVLNQVQELLVGGATRAISGIGPARILISAEGRVVLLDPEDELSAAVSAPAYASPEEIRGAAPDFRSSVYSVGCALFEILTGQPPFTGQDSRQVLQGHLARPAPDVHSIRAEIPPALSAVVATFLAKDPAGRPQDPSRAVQMLKTALAKPAAGGGPVRSEQGAPPRGGVAPATPTVRIAPPSPPKPAPRPAVPVNQFGSSVPKSRPAGSGLPPRAAAASRSAIPGQRPPGQRLPGQGLPGLRPGSRPGAAVGRGRLGRSGEAESDPRAPAPAARASWIFTWFGLALGVLLCLILVAAHAKNSAEPVVLDLSPAEKEQSLDRRKSFRRSLDDDNSIAAAELEKLPSTRLSLSDRADHISKVLDQYPHVAVAPRIAEAISKLHASVDEQAAEAGSSPPEAAPEESASPTPAPPPPTESTEKPEEEKKEENPDDIGAKAGSDDGKGEL